MLSDYEGESLSRVVQHEICPVVQLPCVVKSHGCQHYPRQTAPISKSLPWPPSPEIQTCSKNPKWIHVVAQLPGIFQPLSHKRMKTGVHPAAAATQLKVLEFPAGDLSVVFKAYSLVPSSNSSLLSAFPPLYCSHSSSPCPSHCHWLVSSHDCFLLGLFQGPLPELLAFRLAPLHSVYQTTFISC